ncbi:hypothetical protein RYX41_03355 [Lactiplantibacillus plantarum]|nr:hypothetical protein [Lactiplantibacillus plantarum]
MTDKSKQSKTLKQLQEENELLRIRLAYLEKLEALAQKNLKPRKSQLITELRREFNVKLVVVLKAVYMPNSSYYDALHRKYQSGSSTLITRQYFVLCVKIISFVRHSIVERRNITLIKELLVQLTITV